MIFLLNCVIKASVILCVALLATRALRRQSAALRHCVLAAAILCAALTPALSLLMPEWNVVVPIKAPAPVATPAAPVAAIDPIALPIPAEVVSEVPDVTVSGDRQQTASTHVSSRAKSEHSSQSKPKPFQPSHWMAENMLLLGSVIWMAGLLAMFATLITGTIRLAWIALRAEPVPQGEWTHLAQEIATHYGLTRPPQLLQSRSRSLLVTWGWRRPKILLPSAAGTWPADRIRAVLCHELAHIRRGDWIVQMTAEVLRVIYWFNPLLWTACKSLRIESEQASDDAALSCGIGGSEYAEHLLDVVRSLRQPSRHWSTALSMAHPSTLEQRFKAILNPSLNRSALTRLPIAATLVLFLLVTLPVSMLHGSAVAQAPLMNGMTNAVNALRNIAAVVTAGAAGPIAALEPQQDGIPTTTSETDRGVVQGIVRRADMSAGIPEVEITLEGGPADPKSVQTLIQGVAGRGVVFNPKRIGTVEDVLLDIADQAGAQGVGTGNPIYDDALTAFRATNAARFIAESDPDGRFAIKDVPSGQYTIHSVREGFFDISAGSGHPTKVTVQGQQTTNVTVPLAPGGVVSGHVRDAAGEPMQEVGVQVFSMVFQNGFPVLRGTIQKLTDDHGAYRLFWLPPGQYYVAVNPNGNPNASAQQRTLYPSTLDVGRATPVTVRGGDQISGIDIQLTTESLPKISGKVTSTIPAEETEQQANVLGSGSPLGKPTLMLLGRDPNKPDIGAGTARTIGTVTMNNGTATFEVPGILPGSYDLYVRIPESNANGGGGFAFAKVPLDVKNENVSGISITVSHSVTVNGTVTLDGKSPGSTPIRFQLQPDGSGVKLGVYNTVGQRTVTPDSKGALSIVAVPPGLFRLNTGVGLPPDLYLADVRQNGVSVFDSGIDVTSETPHPLQVALSSGAGTIAGTAVDASGKPLAGAMVVLAPPVGRRQNRALYRTATSDANGKFTIQNIAPGGYQLFAWQQNVPAGAQYNASFLGLYEDRSHFVNVIGKSTTTEQVNAVPLQ